MWVKAVEIELTPEWMVAKAILKPVPSLGGSGRPIQIFYSVEAGIIVLNRMEASLFVQKAFIISRVKELISVYKGRIAYPVGYDFFLSSPASELATRFQACNNYAWYSPKELEEEKEARPGLKPLILANTIVKCHRCIQFSRFNKNANSLSAEFNENQRKKLLVLVDYFKIDETKYLKLSKGLPTWYDN